MSGDVFVVSAPGCGTTFTAVVRLKKAPGSGSTQNSVMVVPARGHHVLLALDRPIERRAVRLSLEGAGIPLEEATMATGSDLVAAAVAAGEPFTTLIVDGSGGCENTAGLLARARTAAAGATVQGIVILDTAAKADFANFRRAGFDAYLVRPVRPHSVLVHMGVCPDHRGEVLSTRPEPERRLRVGPAMPSVLLVEDNEINALLARRMLEKAGCAVRLCQNGRDAVEAIRRVLAGLDVPYDLLLMDVHMPVLDGLEATRIIHELYASQPDRSLKSPPIIALTANAFDEDRRRCIEAGMDDYLAKPFDKNELYRLLERWCGNDSGHGQNASRVRVARSAALTR
jgi:CheY-like chemotaxis protein